MRSGELAPSGAVRSAGWVAAGWAVVLLGWSAYNCFVQVGFPTFVEGVFYYGGDAMKAETGDLNYAVAYLVGAAMILRGRDWARGILVGVALVEGYNRVRSLTGALFDKPQRVWFTGTTEGMLKLVTFGLGVLVAGFLIVVLLRSLMGDRAVAGWAPAPSQWAAPAQPPFAAQPPAPAPAPAPWPSQPQQLQPQPPAPWQQQPPQQASQPMPPQPPQQAQPQWGGPVPPSPPYPAPPAPPARPTGEPTSFLIRPPEAEPPRQQG
ncbi:hypothetical protein [Kitasatospora acidiphila]|uniref:hypothetical protein n=1 Tax=Kitasatospora acidiphila TaxID=2567942 RepID=UPI0015F057E4|nr:hypothetical protein [Kitasatospora acidiphila]